jgi:hypothetical protein
VKTILAVLWIVGGLTLAAAGRTEAPAGAPPGANGQCKDGTYATNAAKKGACKGHKGVKDWWGTEEAKPSKDKAEAKKTRDSKGASASASAPVKESNKPRATLAAGGGPGKVWVNTDTRVYHCSGDRWFGRTKEGGYMTEAEATAQGFRPDHGKACK